MNSSRPKIIVDSDTSRAPPDGGYPQTYSDDDSDEAPDISACDASFGMTLDPLPITVTNIEDESVESDDTSIVEPETPLVIVGDQRGTEIYDLGRIAPKPQGAGRARASSATQTGDRRRPRRKKRKRRRAATRKSPRGKPHKPMVREQAKQTARAATATPSEEKAQPPGQEKLKKKVLNVRYTPSAAQKTAIEAWFPERNIVYGTQHGHHPHLFTKLVRQENEKSIIAKARSLGLATREMPLLDVGFGGTKRSCSLPHVHGCESSDVPSVEHNMHMLERRFTPITDSVINHQHEWTFCKCNAQDCTHGPFSAAMFIHSLYYNTPEDVARILLRTKFRMGWSLHYDHIQGNGTLPAGEGVWKVRDNQMEMTVHGQASMYRHPALRWVCNAEGYLNIVLDDNPIDERDWHLVWNNRQVAPGQTVTHLILLPGLRTPRPPEMVELDDGKTGTVLTYRHHDFVFDVVVFETDTRQVEVPKNLYEQVRLRITGLPLNSDTRKLAFSEARRLVTKAYRNDEAYPIGDTTELIPLIVALACRDTAITTVEQLFPFQTSENYRVQEAANEVLNGPIASIDWLAQLGLWIAACGTPILFFLALVRFMDISWTSWIIKAALWGSSALTLVFRHTVRSSVRYRWWYITLMTRVSIVVFTAMSLIQAWNLLPLFTFFVIPLWIGVRDPKAICIFLLLSFGVPVAAAQTFGDITDYGILGWNAVGVIASTMIITYLIAIWYLKQDPYHNWKQIKIMCENEHRTVDLEGPVPPGAGLVGHETLVDPSDYPIREKASVKLDEEPTEQFPKRLAVILCGIAFTTAFPLVNSTSMHNMYVAIRTRIVAAVAPPTPDSWELVREFMHDQCPIDTLAGLPVSPDGRFHPYTKAEYIDHYDAPRRKKLLRLWLKMRSSSPWKQSQMCYNCFCKREKTMAYTKDEFVPRRPRAIQGCHDVAKILCGAWMYCYSKALVSTWNIDNWIWYCNGATVDDLSHWLNRTIETLGLDAIYVSCDYSKFDMTQSVQAISYEHEHYRRLGLHLIEGGEEYMRGQMHTRGFAKGMRYRVPAMRKSGDLNTSSGNSKLTGDSSGSFYRFHGIPVRMVVLGDDNFAVVSRIHVLRVFGTFDEFRNALIMHMSHLGFQLKVAVSEDPMDGEFLSGRFYPVAGRYRFGRKPGRVLSKCGWFLAPLPKQNPLAATLTSLISSCQHVPFARVYIAELLDYLGGPVADVKLAKSEFRRHGTDGVDPTVETFAAFERVYGLTQTDEHVFRTELRSALKKYGLPCFISSTYVDQMFSIDF